MNPSERKRILTAGPTISQREIDYVLDAVQNGWNEHWSDYLVRFEQAFAQYVGTRFALATSSCTGALHLSLLALGVGPGDEVLVPEVTWVATASAVKLHRRDGRFPSMSIRRPGASIRRAPRARSPAKPKRSCRCISMGIRPTCGRFGNWPTSMA